MNKYKFKAYGKEFPVGLQVGKYMDDSSLAIQIRSFEDGVEEPYATLTTRFPESASLPSNCAFVNTHIGGRDTDILDWLYSNGLGIPLDFAMESGLNTYPAVKFNLEQF